MNKYDGDADTAEQRAANASLAGVDRVLEVSDSVINESAALQSQLETIESDALEALQRTNLQHTAAAALNQVLLLDRHLAQQLAYATTVLQYY